MKNLLKLSLLFLSLAIVGCGTQNSVDSNPAGSKQIIDLVINETDDSLVLNIRGNQPLTYSEEKQDNPDEILFYFPDTSIIDLKGYFRPPVNDFISYMKIDQYVENNTTISAIYISLAKETPYQATLDNDGLLVTFPRNPVHLGKPIPQSEPIKRTSVPRPVQKSAAAATVLSTITTEPHADSLAVNVRADGSISNYKDFTMVNPDRIVFDLYNIKSPYSGEQKIAVRSKWVKRIRHYGHPDKLRLVIETQQDHLSKYSSSPTDTGLIIHIGSTN